MPLGSEVDNRETAEGESGPCCAVVKDAGVVWATMRQRRTHAIQRLQRMLGAALRLPESSYSTHRSESSISSLLSRQLSAALEELVSTFKLHSFCRADGKCSEAASCVGAVCKVLLMSTWPFCGCPRKTRRAVLKMMAMSPLKVALFRY